MASQVAYSSSAYSAMSSSSSSASSVVGGSIGAGSPEDTDRLLRLVAEDAGLRKEALDALIRSVRRGNGRLATRNQLSLFQPVGMALRDPDWEVRNKAINLLVEVTPKFGSQLSEGMAEVLPGLVACLADIKVANRRATTQCLHTYMKTMGSANTEPVLGAIIRYGLDAADPEIQRNVCVSVPVLLTPDLAGGNFSQLVAALARCLTSKDEAMANAALHALEAIRSTLGDQLFNGYVQQLNPPLRRYYYQVSGHSDPSVVMAATAAVDAAALSRSPSMQRRPIPGIADQYNQQQHQQQQQHYQPLSSVTSTDAFGCVPRYLVDQLDDREDISLRAQAIEELRTHLRQLDSLEAAVPHLEKFLAFLHSLLDDVNFRIAIVTLDILYLLGFRLGSRLQPHLRTLLAGVTKRMADSKNVVRTALMKLAILLMNNHRPQVVLDHLLNNLEHRNSRVRQETLNMTIAALVTFPSSDFDLARLCSCVAPALLDPKRQVRHAALEVMALLAQGLGSGRLQPLQLAVREQEARPDAAGLFEAVMSRLAKRQLPRLTAEGLVEYAIPVPSSATRRPGQGPAGGGVGSGGANEDWVMQASAGGYGSARSRSELVDLETDVVSDRRKSSAGRLAKGKLPWEAASSEPSAPAAPSQEANRQQQQQPQQPQQQQQQQKQQAQQQKQQPTTSNESTSSSPNVQKPQTESPGQQGPSGYVTNGKVKKFTDIPTEQPRKVKRFLDQSERQLDLHLADSPSPGSNQTNSNSKGSYSKNLEQQQLAKTRPPKLPKRPELITTEVLDDLPTSRSLAAVAAPQQPAVEEVAAASSKLPAIAKQQSSKKASDSAAATDAKRKQGAMYDSGHGDTAEPASPVPMKPQLARSAGKKPKRAVGAAGATAAAAAVASGSTNSASDSGVAATATYSTANSTAPSSSRSSQVDAADDHQPEEMNGSLQFIRHSASRKKALKVFENAENSHGAAAANGASSASGKSSASGPQDISPDNASGLQSRYNPHQGATFRPNPSYQSEVVGRAYGDDPGSGGYGEFGDSGTPPASVVRGRQQQRKHLRGTYSSSPVLASSAQGIGESDGDSALQKAEFNIVGRGVFEVQPAAASPLPRAEVLTGSASGSKFGTATATSAAEATAASNGRSDSPLAGGVLGTAYQPNSADEAAAGGRTPPTQQQLQRALSNTLRESLANKQRQKAAAERSSSKAETEDERLIRELRETPVNAETPQLSQRQQREQPPDFDSELAKELRQEQLAISKRHTESIGADSDTESSRGTSRNSALANLNRKVSEQSFGPLSDATAATKPPAPRRNLSRPPRPSVSQAEPPSSSESLQSGASASGPLANPDRSLQDALTRLQDPDWQAKCEGLQLVQRLAANHPDVAAREMHPLTLAVIAEVKNLRSQVSRLAIQTLGCLLQHLGKRMDAELEQCAKILLLKGGETNKFILEDAESALVSMVEHCNHGRALGAIIQGGASHKSSQVRGLCAQILSILCDRMGPGRVLSGVKDVTDKLLVTAANFCLDGSQETRYWGRVILHPLLSHQDFDALISKHVPPAAMRNLKDVLENLRQKGVGDQPLSAFSAGARSRRGASAGSADSASLAGSYASSAATASGQSAPLGRQQGAAASNIRLNDEAANLVKTACQQLNAPDWKERLAGIKQLAKLSEEKTDLVGQCIVKFTDAFAPRLGDSNSKVQQQALETALRLVYPLRNYLPSVANALVQHAAPVLSSKSAELASLAGQLLDIFIQELDSEKLAQPFVQAVATGNPRSKPELVDKLAALAERLAPRKPRLSQVHVEPELFRLLAGLASAPGAGSVALKSSAYRLAQTLANYSSASELLDRARSNPQCTPQAVAMLEDALRH